MKISTQKQKTESNAVFGKIGIFSASLLAASSAIYIYSPVVSSHADSSIEAEIGANVNPVASLSLDVNELNFVITPTVTGAFDSKSVTATVSTNSTEGYELYFSSVDNDTDMVSSAVSSVIASDFSGTVTSTTMAANKWGYSLNNTDFSPIPALSSQATIKNLDHFPTQEERTTTIDFGMKINDSLPSGHYAKSVVFSVLAHEPQNQPGPTSQTMQNFDCSTMNIGDTTTLVDIRDNNTYEVVKLEDDRALEYPDGRCWMRENLRISDMTITDANSDLATGRSFTIPASDTSAFTDYDNAAVFVNDEYGGYYNWYTATAGEGVYASVDTDVINDSICPKGWDLPDINDFGGMYGRYDNNEKTRGLPGYVIQGVVSNGTLREVGQYGVYWSATSDSVLGDETTSNARALALNQSYVFPGSSTNKKSGGAVRCVAR